MKRLVYLISIILILTVGINAPFVRSSSTAVVAGTLKLPTLAKSRALKSVAVSSASAMTVTRPKAGDKWKGVMGPIPPGVKAPKIPSIKKTTRDIGKYGVVAGLAYVAGKAKAKKEAKAKETKEKLKKSEKM